MYCVAQLDVLGAYPAVNLCYDEISVDFLCGENAVYLYLIFLSVCIVHSHKNVGK